MAFIFLSLINRTIGLRVSLVEEIIGADIVEHGIGRYYYILRVISYEIYETSLRQVS